jgi:hypothetical protein
MTKQTTDLNTIKLDDPDAHILALGALTLDQLLDLEGKMYDLRKQANLEEWANTMIDRIEVALEIATKKAAQDAQLPIEQSTWHHNGVRQA